MMHTISKDFEFSAAHQLRGLPEGHPCSRMHGHNYVARIEISTMYLNEVGFVIDYGKLSAVKQVIDNNYDHRILNDVMRDNPTAENLAAYIAEITFAWLGAECANDDRDFSLRVGVSETPKTWTWYAYPEVA